MIADIKGLFISFEGGEGLGKTTLTKRLSEELRGNNYNVRLLREPGGTLLGEEIRHTLKHSDANKGMVSETELLLFNASRAQLVQEIIRPALAAGEVIICDRFYDSTLAYQGYGRGLPLDKIRGIIDFAVGGTRPDVTFWVDGTYKQGIENRAAQLAASGTVKVRDRIEDEAGEAFFGKVYTGFKTLHEEEPSRIKRIEYVHNNMDAMYSQIKAEVKRFRVFN